MTSLFIAVLLAAVLHVALMAFWSWALRVRYAEVSFGLGLKLFSIGRLTVRLFPLGGFVRHLEGSEGHQLPADETIFEKLSLWKRIALVLAPIATLLLLSYLILGSRAGTSFFRGFGQVLSGVVSPFGTAQDLLRGMLDVSQNGVFLVIASVVCAKICVWNCFPVGGTPAGNVMAQLLVGLGVSERRVQTVFLFLLLSFLPILFSWWIAGGWFVWKSLA